MLGNLLFHEVESRREDAALWDAHSHLDMPLYARTDSNRARRLSPAFKLAASDAVDNDPDLDNAAQLLAGSAFGQSRGPNLQSSRQTASRGKSSKTKRLKRRCGLQSDAAKKVGLTKAAQYNATGFKLGSACKHAFLGFDGGAAGGYKWLSVANWSSEHNIGWWLPPQARDFCCSI